MAPKRRKKDGGAKSSAAAAAASSNTRPSDENPLSALLTSIQLISKDKTRSSELLQAFSDGKCRGLLIDSLSSSSSSTTSTEEHLDCYWILMTTHVLSRMVQHLQQHKGGPHDDHAQHHVAIVAAPLCHSLATILYADKIKLDKCAAHHVGTDVAKAGTKAVRSALARAIMTLTICSTVVLEYLGQADLENMDVSLIRRAIWAATTALEMVVHHAAAPKVTAAAASSSDGWNHAQYWLLQDAAHLDLEHEEGLLGACEDACRSLNMSKEEDACLACLTSRSEVEPSSSSTGNKRRRANRAKDDPALPSNISKQFRCLMEQTQFSIMIDGRVSIRRWASMAFVWFLQGQQRMLDFCDSILSYEDYWKTILDCPAVIGLKDPPRTKTSSASKTKRGSVKKPASDTPKTSPPVHIPGNVSVVAMVSRLMIVISESGSNCGSRAPTGGMDIYAAQVLNPVTTIKGRARSASVATAASENLPAWKRPDVREVASVVIYKLIQSHTACLKSNCASPETFGRVLVNDETDGFAASVPNGVTRPLEARFYPAVHKSLNSLCSAAAASGGEATNVADSAKRLLGMTAAFILSCGEMSRGVVDAKLYGLAIGQLADCLRMIVSDDDRTGAPRAMEVDSQEEKGTRHARLLQEYHLDEPIPIPSLSQSSSPSKPSRKKRKKKADDSLPLSFCSFGGIFPQQPSTPAAREMTSEQLLSLLIRAVQSTSEESPPPAAMYTELIDLVRCCYDLNEPAFETKTAALSSADDGSSKRKGKKRSASTKAPQGRQKRKKISKDASQVVRGDKSATRGRKPMSLKSARAGLATDALNSICMMLMLIPATSSASHPRRELRGYLRETLTTKHICGVVGLGHMISEALIESHLASQAEKKLASGSAQSSFFSATHSGDFRSYEKLLWAAHIKLCQTIGRDHFILEGTNGASGKLSVFHALAASSELPTRSAQVSNTAERWPLCLPAAHHVLVASSLAREPVPAESDADPERFIAQSFLSSICFGLRHLSSVSNEQWYSSSSDVEGRDTVALYDSVPLALRDARLFVLAVARLPTEEREQLLSKFASEVSDIIEDVKSSASSRALVKEDADVSGYIARTVTVCFSLVSVVVAGSRHRDALAELVRSSHYGIPNLVSKQEIAPTKRMEDGDWFRSETSFVGVFSGWDSPVVPDVNGPVQFITLQDDVRSKLRSLHESALALGFLSAERDRGHLMFSAWNASGGSSSWEKIPATISRSESSATDEEDCIRRLLDIRDDVCSLYRDVHGDHGLPPNSILTRVLAEQSASRQTGQLKRKLSTMMSKAEAIVDSILSTAPVRDQTYELPKATLALLEGVTAYVAFIAATHTRTNESDLVSRILSNGSRLDGPSYSDDEESASDYDEGADEDRIEALMKLGEACKAFGAAPTHPDWLDTTCYLRDGITSYDAIQIAQRAMTCSEKISSVARLAHIQFLSRAMEAFFENENDVHLAGLAVKLCLSCQTNGEIQVARSSDESNSDEAELWTNSIASLCRLENWQVKLFTKDANCKNFAHTMEAFCRSSVQRIEGALHIRNDSFDDCEPSLGESRALGEWELLLSEALLGSCMCISFPAQLSENSGHNVAEQVFRKNFLLAMRWSRVQAAQASHLMPAAALLRFGLSGGVGRKRHRLVDPEQAASDDGAFGIVSASHNFCEPLPSSLVSRPTSSHGNAAIDRILGNLAELALVPVRNDVTNMLKQPCVALASNLMIDTKAFSHLASMNALRSTFESIHRIRGILADLGETGAHRSSSAICILERLVGYAVANGESLNTGDKAAPRLEGLYTFLGGRSVSFDTLTAKGSEFDKVLSASKYPRLDWRKVQGQAVTDIVGLLSFNFEGSVEIVSQVCDMLKCLLRRDHDHASSSCEGKGVTATSLSTRIIRAFNSQDESYFRTLAEWIVCNPHTDEHPDAMLERTRADLCAFLSYAVGVACPRGQKAGELIGESILLDALQQSMSSWLVLKPPASTNVLSILCLLGVRNGSLHTIGSRLLSIMATKSEVQSSESVAAVELFFRFLRDLEQRLVPHPPAPNKQSSDNLLPREASPGETVETTKNAVPDACSFVRRSGFHQQHWYNCYTCNLVWDKGCCSLCALVCHQAEGHDVTYSRHSSFFCDCGGEVPTEDDNRGPCKCLTPIDSQAMHHIADGQQWPVIDRLCDSTCSDQKASSDSGEEDCMLYNLALTIASSRLGSYSRSSLEQLRTEAESQSWTSFLFDSLRAFRKHGDVKSENILTPACEKGEEQIPSSRAKDVSIPSISGRSGKVLELQPLTREVFVPLRGAGSGTFQLRMSTDASTDRIKRAALAKNGVRRRALVADCRGRMIVAEPCSLVFCAALPCVNVRYDDKPSDVPFSRGQMGILGSCALKFHIVGMDLCRENECHLAVWGTSEASVVILNKTVHKAERVVDLTFELEADEVDYAIKCIWIPGSQTMLALVCGLFVKIFDIRLEEDGKVNSVASYTLAYEAMIRDAALVPATSPRTEQDTTSKVVRSPSVPGTVNLFLLLDIGHLLELGLNFDESGQVKEQGDMYIESGVGAYLPVGGVRLNHSNHQPASAGATTRSMGEASGLTYLPLSRVLLYSCASSPVLALLLDGAGRLSGSFEMLPYTVKSDVIRTDGYNIQGPFTQFTELGCIEEDGERSFRIVCVGRSSRTSHPKLLCLDFNEEAVRVRELMWRTSVGGPSMSLSSSFDGVATFSVPTLVDSAIGNSSLKRSDFFERTCLCVVTSNGSMVMFGEEIAQEDRTSSACTSKPPQFPLTLYERLINVSESDRLIFDGDRIGSSTDSEAVKSKLSSHNSTYFMCPSRDGCTITISLSKGSNAAIAAVGEKRDGIVDESMQKNLPVLREMMRSDEVIVAVRLLVGSTTTEFIPKYVSVEGRRVWLQPDMKKQYDLPLTAEEIGSALRNGFVSLGIGPSFDSGNNPLLDAVEVYAATREQICHWLPFALSEMHVAQPEEEGANLATAEVEAPAKEDTLALIVASLTHVIQIRRTKSDITPEALDIIRGLAQTTALQDKGRIRQSLVSLLGCVEPDKSRQQRILDVGTLTGTLKALQSASGVLCEAVSEIEDNEGSKMDAERTESASGVRWNQVKETVKSCLKVSAVVAGERPENYMAALKNMLAGKEERSIAVVADSILRKALKSKATWLEIVPDLVGLCLEESMLFNETGERFASFDTLSDFLGSSDDKLVKVCCASILSYWEQRISKSKPTVSYQCDCCSLFPIEGARYTFPDSDSSLGHDADTDLCGDCYSHGKDFAAQNRYDARINVKIRGKTIGKKKKLTCARLGQMERLPVLTPQAKPAPSESSIASEAEQPFVDLQSFSSVLFRDLVRVLVERLRKMDPSFSLAACKSLVDLVLDVIRNTHDDDAKLNRAMDFSERLLACLPNLILTISRNDELEEVARSTLTICVQGLAQLAALKRNLSVNHAMPNLDTCSVDDCSPAKSKEKTDPRYVCDAHGVAAVRRRCSHGVQKDRRFYVCGMDRKSRCNYFKWADAEDKGQPTSSGNPRCKYTDEIGRFVWEILNKSGEDGSQPLSVQLCKLIAGDAHDQMTGALSLPLAVMGERKEATSSTGEEKTLPTLPSTYDQRAAALDYLDGVFCAQKKRWGIDSHDLLGDFFRVEPKESDGEATLFQSILDLFSYVADTLSECDGPHDKQVSSGWFPLLCEVISSSRIPHYRDLSKRVLKRLCGGNRGVYHGVRDHYVFASQFQKLLHDAQSPLQASLIIKEQARQCGIHWRTGEKTSFRVLPAGGLIGTNDLVSEDCVTVYLDKRIGVALDELERTANSRGGNWRNFCCLTGFPTNQQGSSARNGLVVENVESALLTAPPIVSLLWIASVLSGENQVKVLRLIDIAMRAEQDSQIVQKISSAGRDATASSNLETSNAGDTDTTSECRSLLGIHTTSSFPEMILQQGDNALLVDEVHAFIVQFVVSGNSSVLRKLGGQVAIKLSRQFEGEDFDWLFSALVNRALSELPELGSTCIELFRVLQSMASNGETISSSSLMSISRKVSDAFTSQMRFLCQSRPAQRTAPLDTTGTKVTPGGRYDFARCVCCHRSQVTPTTSVSEEESGSNSLPTRLSPTATAPLASDQTVALLPEQVRPFAKESLDSSIDVSLSDEFAMYVQLKCRLALSDVHVTVGDPRGRYVKTIAFFFSPRPVSDPNILKSEAYADVWQRCATISLPKGATRASCKLPRPVVAANLKIGYLEFYERPGGSRAPDGSLLLHCPRCTRVVNNAHGVCGHCGEVAFQCRKCRHINYDRLDAFLCVECGYCSAGTFSFDLTCGAASNAVAVVDDESYERSIKVLRVATKLHDELRSSLHDRVEPSSKKRSLSVHRYGPALKRTFLGELPKIIKEKADTAGGSSGSRVRSLVGSSSSDRVRDESSFSAGGDRARSLLRLARQIRNESSSASDRSRGGDLLSQALMGSSGRGVSIEEMDELDFISADLDGSDPLSRLVASMQGRSRDASSAGREDGAPSRSSENAQGNTRNDSNEEDSEAAKKAKSDECDRLYQLMREAERECYELHKRIRAWKRLENDALADLGTTESCTAFSPSKCSTCSGPVAMELLALFMSLFELNAGITEPAVTQGFVRALFDESVTLDKELFDAKRAAIVSLAAKSEQASKVILDLLRLRLNGSRDVASAEIMGKIIAIDSPLGEDFVKLASEILASGYW